MPIALKTATSPPIHAVVGSVALSSVHMVWIPLASALVGAVIGAWAVFRNTKREWRRKQAQARRALQIEMYMNARMLRVVANKPDTVKDCLVDMLTERDFSEVFRAHFTEAMGGVAWTDVSCLLRAYEVAGAAFTGKLVRAASEEAQKKVFIGSVDNFCTAIRALSKYEKLEDAFYEEVAKFE
ncbi:MAG: hypothetical protein ACYDEV_09260 [Acidiferrobacter sp.]